VVLAGAHKDFQQAQKVMVKLKAKSYKPFVWVPNARKAAEYALALEICAEMALKTITLNPAIVSLPEALREKHFLRKHGKAAYYGQP